MTPSIIKILGGFLDHEKLRLTIEAEPVLGKPKVGEAVFVPRSLGDETHYEILAIHEKNNSNQFNLILNFWGPEFESDWEIDWINTIIEGNDSAVCWLTMETYRSLTVDQKYRSFTQFAEVNNVGRVAEFIKDNLKPFLKIAITDDLQSHLSKFGGLPFAPKGFEFPKDGNGRSALFICQLHLGALKHFPTVKDFRGDGILYFFGTIGRDNRENVFGDILVGYADKIDDLHFVTLPGDLVNYGTYPQKQLVFDEQLALPEDDDHFVGDQIAHGEEYDCYSYLTSLLWYFNWEQIFALLRPAMQIPSSYFFSAYLRHNNLDYHAWTHVDKVLRTQNYEELKANAMAMAKSMQWRHLFEFQSTPGDVFQLSNIKGEFDRYQSGYTVIISQQDLNNMDFGKVISIDEKIQVY
jgi:hypothetical protein